MKISANKITNIIISSNHLDLNHENLFFWSFEVICINNERRKFLYTLMTNIILSDRNVIKFSGSRGGIQITYGAMYTVIAGEIRHPRREGTSLMHEMKVLFYYSHSAILEIASQSGITRVVRISISRVLTNKFGSQIFNIQDKPL